MADSKSHERALGFRRELTPPEARLYVALRGRKLRGLKFRRQHPIGPYILDFYCAAAKLAVEVDGASHLTVEQGAHDERRTSWLDRQDIKVLRIAAADVRDHLVDVLGWIGDAAEARLPDTPGRPLHHAG
ncbi:MAG: endonuclease domain-containing protein [Brevundimonas sp.]